MENWFGLHWFDLIQTVGIIGGLLFTALTIRKDQEARTVTNLLAINEQYSRIWHEFHDRLELARILKKDLDLNTNPMSDQESRFVKTLLLHLDVVRRTMEAGIFVKIEGLQTDIRDFFEHPIPKAVWNTMKPFQDKNFVQFIEDCLKK